MNQPTLWEAPSVPVDTSEAAAAKIVGKAARLREAVYLYLKAVGSRGATERELEEALGLRGNTLRPRLWELEGNAPAGKPPRPRRIQKTPEKREGARVYQALAPR